MPSLLLVVALVAALVVALAVGVALEGSEVVALVDRTEAPMVIGPDWRLVFARVHF
jgi:hypothetical protein